MNYILEEFNKTGADGVDFVPMNDTYFNQQFHLCHVICSYTKEQWINDLGNKYIPKTPRLYWKMVEGNKTYIEY